MKQSSLVSGVFNHWENRLHNQGEESGWLKMYILQCIHTNPLKNTAHRTSTVVDSINTFPTDLADLTDHGAIRQLSAFGQHGLSVHLHR